MSTTFAPYYSPVYPNIRPHPPTYSPLSSGLPSPSFGPIQLPRGRSPTPATSRQPSRQQSIRRFSSISRHPSTAAVPRTPLLFDHLDFSAIADDILSEGDIIGQGDILHGESIELVHIATSAVRSEPPPATHFRVVRKLGAGSYAVVYLVKEITSFTPIPADDDDILSDTEGSGTQYRYTYGREFAVKCLSKASLSPEELVVQMFEAKLHQSLPSHSNIVTLHRTLQTRSFLLLVLEWVPGEDLFYFLEQSRDHQPSSIFDDSMLNVHPTSSGRSVASRNANPTSVSETPPTPSLLSTLHPNHLLSYQRLRLISSMFAQMCDAVDACHARGVSHRDIKPENFIVTEGTREQGENSISERKVLVKLTDFGLATLQQESSDVDCGSAPYMSYECRNNVAPTYATQPADVWSLGIVLINMLYHHNPWSDTSIFYSAEGAASGFACPSFASFLSSPIPFFLQRFPGMTPPVAEFLATRVFCLLPPPGTSPNPRVTAREFGDWVKNLPKLMGQGPPNFERRVSKLSVSQLAGDDWDHRVIEGTPLSHDEDDEKVPSGNVVVVVDDASSLPEPLPPIASAEIDMVGEHASVSPPGDDDKRSIRSASTKRRGKRGARKKHSAPGDGSVPVPTQQDEHLEFMAADIKNLARQISSQTSRVTNRPSSSSMVSTTSSTITARSKKSGKSSTERALARMPPAPSIPPPVPPSTSSGLGRTLALAALAGKSHESIQSSLSWQGSVLPPLPGSPTEEQPPEPVVKPHSDLDVPQQSATTLISPSSSSKSLATTSTTTSFASANPTLTPKKSWRERLGLKDGGHASSSSSSLAESVGAIAPPGRSAARPPQFGIPDISGSRRQATPIGKPINGSSSHLAPVPEVSSPPAPSNLAENVKNIISTLEPAPPKSSKPIPTSRSNKEDRGRALKHDSMDDVDETGSYGKRNMGRWQETSPRRGHPSSPSAVDTASNWRSGHQNAPSISGFSMASSHGGTASSASSTYTRFSNASLRSVSTANTSISGTSSHYGMRTHGQYSDKPFDQQSWRSSLGSEAGEPRPRPRKPVQRSNVKRMDGVPWELDQLPRQSHPRINGVLPQGHIHGTPPDRKKGQALRPVSAQSNVLGTINERHTATSPLAISSHVVQEGDGAEVPPSPPSSHASSTYDPQKKGVQKGQVNSLGKLLLSLKR